MSESDKAAMTTNAATLDVAVRRLQASEASGESREELFRLFVESVQDYAVFMLDTRGNVATWNVGAQRIKGYLAHEIIGSHFSRFYTEEELRAGKCELELRGAAEVGRFEDEGWRVRKDGTHFWANVVISAVRSTDGTLIGFSKITRDLTERKRAEEERTARVAAEAANRAKDEFLAILGHELRNPLAPIVTALQLIRLRDRGQIPREYTVIDRQVQHMMRLVDDLLDVSRITAGKIELRKRPVDVREAVAKAIETVSSLLEQRQHHLEVEAPDEPVMVDADESRLGQVFTNLMTNAAKYTECGGHIQIRISATAAEVSIAVCDDGNGIEPQLLPRVFNLFVQGQRGSERTEGGLGIGLPLARSLAELHGGSIEAQSAGAGSGSTFTVQLPLAGASREKPIAALALLPNRAGDGGAQRRILVVDDNEDARQMLAAILTMQGYNVQSASDGPEALQIVKTFAPDVAILDIGLPVMDGFELASRLRDELGPMPRLIALTGYGQRNDRERSKAAGFSVHLVKPVDIEMLIDNLALDSPALS
ncbi:MAG: ATP-binding protein [Gammaproteobacteria bacterium]